MAWTITTGTVSGTVGSLITALDLELVTNRGWTKEFSGTNKAAYRNSASALARKYMRIVDDGTAPITGAREALIQGFDTMTDVDTGTGQFPTSGNVYVRKSYTADATARTYLAVGDDKTFYLFILTGDSVPGQYLSHGFGDFYSYKPGDNQACILFARPNNVPVSTESQYFWYWNNYSYYINTANYIGGTVAGTSGEVQLGKMVAGAACNWHFAYNNVNGLVGFPNTADGAIWLSPYQLITSAGGGAVADKVVRGKLRGIFFPLQSYVNFNDGDTFSGAGDLAARSFRIIKGIGYNGTPGFAGAIETTEPESST